jgi:hypothetical protein
MAVATGVAMDTHENKYLRDPEDRVIDDCNEEQRKDKAMDKTLADSFPASDPPAWQPWIEIVPFRVFCKRNCLAPPNITGRFDCEVIVDRWQESKRWPGGPKMAQWQYETFCTELNRSVDFDEELRKILQNYGMKGWELVQVLQPKNDTRYHLVFKTERSLYPNLEPAKQ